MLIRPIVFKTLCVSSIAVTGMTSCNNNSSDFSGKSPVPKNQLEQKSQAEAVTELPTAQATASPGVSPSPEASPTITAYGSCSQPCNGASKVFQNTRYNKWVKVVLCSSSRYDILLGESQNGPFYKVGDNGGHGQDHCELVNNNFATLKSDDDVTSGNCPTCKVSSAGSVTNIPAIYGTKIFQRSKMGEQFQLIDATAWGSHTSCWYECGMSF